jgi:hypothetical protein
MLTLYVYRMKSEIILIYSVFNRQLTPLLSSCQRKLIARFMNYVASQIIGSYMILSWNQVTSHIHVLGSSHSNTYKRK